MRHHLLRAGLALAATSLLVLLTVGVAGAVSTDSALSSASAPSTDGALSSASAPSTDGGGGQSGSAAIQGGAYDGAHPLDAAPPSRWVAVSVATLWVKPRQARAVDAPACASPADPRTWVATMSLRQKRWLDGRLETQALYGTQVYLLAQSGSWSKVAVSDQPTPRNAWGYPGWIPTRQLTATAPLTGSRIAVVRHRTAWLWKTATLKRRILELSYDTRLPAVRWTSKFVEVVLLDGRHLYLRRAVVALHAPDAAWPQPTGAQVVKEAKRFLGLQYLWAGTSGFGFDCSGLTHSVFHELGVTIPRDAAPQALQGTKVSSRSALQPSDLIFFRSAAGAIHHVGLYIGGGIMIHSPATGQPVHLSSISSEPYLSEFAGGRRYADGQ